MTWPTDNERSCETIGDGRLGGEHVALLVARAADGDQAAWNALVDEFGGLVWATTRVHGLSAAQAADVVQSTWLRLVENLARVEDPGRLGAWLAMTARRESLKVIRSAGPTSRRHALPDWPRDARALAERLPPEHNTVPTQAALQRLGPHDRALLRMLASKPTPRDAEISAALGIAVESIGPMRARALTRLRREPGLTARGS